MNWFDSIWGAVKTVIPFLATAKITKDLIDAKTRKNTDRANRAVDRIVLRYMERKRAKHRP